MKTLTFLAILLQLTVTAGHENGNGGQTIQINGNAYLRDIVEKNNCIWKSSNIVKNENPTLGKVINKLESYHWLLSYRLEEELSNLKFCFTTRKLPPLSYNNSDDLYIFTNQIFDQPAINAEGIIFIDTNIFDKMDDIHKAFILVHEASHEFFDKKEARSTREPRLRELIMNLHYAYENNSDYESIKTALEMARMQNIVSNIDGISKETYDYFLNTNFETIEEYISQLDTISSYKYLSKDILKKYNHTFLIFSNSITKESTQKAIDDYLQSNPDKILSQFFVEDIYKSIEVKFLIEKNINIEKLVTLLSNHGLKYDIRLLLSSKRSKTPTQWGSRERFVLYPHIYDYFLGLKNTEIQLILYKIFNENLSFIKGTHEYIIEHKSEWYLLLEEIVREASPNDIHITVTYLPTEFIIEYSNKLIEKFSKNFNIYYSKGSLFDKSQIVLNFHTYNPILIILKILKDNSQADYEKALNIVKKSIDKITLDDVYNLKNKNSRSQNLLDEAKKHLKNTL